ncbi:DNA-directed RNA polymerase subunit alpha [Patescibacteria group bacterium]|nr:DNA-directed RNA polymerase subunit alpha [Patescibacteria group bacterium]MCL5409351.1 DNA-directed RNA polymerase subunit alpha [Patescibacteria group bacterium]
MINFKTNIEEKNDRMAVVSFEPLEPGFGHTLGSVLRRVMLSSLEGAAITSVKIDGVSHQFSTISGISEDVIQLILNLKNVRIKVFSDQPIKLRLKASGKGEVKARDIDCLGNGEIVNPDLHIASLNAPSAKLSIEMTAEKGIGYIMADDKKSSEIGVIPIDSIYTPVLSVNYKVEPTRVGRNSKFDKLIVEITSDGTIKPTEALDQASRIMSAYFKQIFEPVYDGEEIVAEPTVADSVLKMSVEELDLPVRITNALKAVDIDTVERLTTVPRSTLLKAKNLGVQSLNLISQKLTERGLTLSEA